ncbi:LysR family transcriptional regulator [Achromobacter sp. NPDC058515]|uniref:LysR family transcriptional regulator n=1 Tax=Achromobacter sp. NPDC058515 TaxID=3346533 RepID=UPI00365AEB83
MNWKIDDIPWARKLKYRHLEVFLTIAEARGITAAADALHMTQSAVSHWLADIEALLGLPLCERGRAHFSLTPAGELLAAHARRMVGEIRRTHQDLDTLKTGLSGRIHIGSILSAAPALLPKTIARFQARHPDVFLHVLEATLEVLLEKLELRELDLIIGPLDIRVHKLGLASSLLIDDALRVVARKGHPLAQSPAPGWPDVARYGWIMPPQGTLMRRCLEQAFMDQGMPVPSPRVETASIITVQTLLRETDYLTVLSRSVAEHYQEVGFLDAVALAPEIAFAKLGAVWTRDNDTALLRRFRDDLHAEAERLVAD